MFAELVAPRSPEDGFSVATMSLEHLGPLVQQIALDAQFHRNQGSGFGAGLQQFDRSEVEFLAVALPFAASVDLLDFLSHLTPPVVLSIIKSVRETGVSSFCVTKYVLLILCARRIEQNKN